MFDGAVRRAVFTKFHRECVGTAESYEYCGLAHSAGRGDERRHFGPGENAIVDFKYSHVAEADVVVRSPQSAFLTPEMRAHFEAGQTRRAGERGSFSIRTISRARD